MLRLVEEAGVFHAYLENVVFSAEMIRMREMVESGAIGRLITFRAREGHSGPHARALLGRRAGRRRRAAGHGLARRRGRALHVRQGRRRCATSFAWGATLVHGDRTTGEDNAVMLIRFEDGRAATMDVSWSSQGRPREPLRGVRRRRADRPGHDLDAAPGVHRAPAGYLGEKADADTGWVFPVPERDLRPRPRRDDGPTSSRRSATAVTPRETFEDGLIVNADPRRRLPLDAQRRMGGGPEQPVSRRWPRRDDRDPPALPWMTEATALLERVAATQADAIETGQPVVCRRDRRGRPGPPLRDRPLADPGRGDVPALRLVPGLQPDRRAVDDVPHPGRGRQRPAPGDVHRADARPGRGDPVELHVRPAGRDDRLLGRRHDRRPGRDGARRAAPRGLRVIAVTSRRQSMSVGARPRGRRRACSTRPTSSSTCARPTPTRWSTIDGLDTPVGPGSTLAAVAIVNSIKVRTAELLVERGAMPPVITRASVVGDRALADTVRRSLSRARAAHRPRDRPVTRRWVI